MLCSASSTPLRYWMSTPAPPPPPSLDQLKLPPGWELKYTKKGTPFFLDHINKTTRWDPPPGTTTSSKGVDSSNPLAALAAAAMAPTDGSGDAGGGSAEGVVIIDGDLLVCEEAEDGSAGGAKRKVRKKRTMTYHLKKKMDKLAAHVMVSEKRKKGNKDDLASFTKRYVVMQRLHITIFESRTARASPVDTIPLNAVKDVEYGDGTRFDLVFAGGNEASFHAPNSDVAQAWVEAIEDRVLDLGVEDGNQWKDAHDAKARAAAAEDAAKAAAAAKMKAAKAAEAASARAARLAQLTKAGASDASSSSGATQKAMSRVQRAAEARRRMQLKRQERLSHDAHAQEEAATAWATASAAAIAETGAPPTEAAAHMAARASTLASSTEEERAIEAAYAIEVAVEEAVNAATDMQTVMNLPSLACLDAHGKTAALRHVFDAADKNGDGFLTPSEFVRSLRKGAGARLADSLFHQMKLFQTIDTEGMGMLSFDDFQSGLESNADPAILLWINVSVSVQQSLGSSVSDSVVESVATGKVSPWEGWDRHVCPESRASYYVDPASGSTKWGDELRALQAAHAAGGGLGAMREDDEEEYDDEEEEGEGYDEYDSTAPLPAAAGADPAEGLVRHVDPTSRASYYFDPASGSTTWGDELRAMRADFSATSIAEEEAEVEYDDAGAEYEEPVAAAEGPTIMTDANGDQYYYDCATGETRWVEE